MNAVAQFAHNESVSTACQKSGGAGKLASAIGASLAKVNAWIGGAEVSAELCPAIEQVSGVSCDDLRPDLLWFRDPTGNVIGFGTAIDQPKEVLAAAIRNQPNSADKLDATSRHEVRDLLRKMFASDDEIPSWQSVALTANTAILGCADAHTSARIAAGCSNLLLALDRGMTATNAMQWHVLTSNEAREVSSATYADVAYFLKTIGELVIELRQVSQDMEFQKCEKAGSR